MIGAGAGDTLAEAVDLATKTGTRSFPMYWDESYASWGPFGVGSTPSTILIGADGTPIGSWRGAFDKVEAAKLANESIAENS